MAADRMPDASLPEAVARALRGPLSELALLVDFDGTLAPIVDDPDDARPNPQARQALEALAPRVALAACVTGRPARQARELLGIPGLTYSGLHGAELLLPGDDHPQVPAEFAADGEAVAALIADAEAEPRGLGGLRVEHKGPIVALHWRRAADPAEAQSRAEELGERARAQGLRTGSGRAVLELRPGLQITKGDAARTLLANAGARAALMAGDDITDLDAFAALRALRHDGALRSTCIIAVAGDDAPAAVAEAGDVVVSGPAELGTLLAAIARHGEER